MAVVPLASLARVDDATPSTTAQVVSVGDAVGAERIAAFSPSAGRASRSSAAVALQPPDDRAVPTTSTSTTSTTSTTAAPKPKPTTTTTAKPKPATTTTAKPKPPPTTTTTTAPPPQNRQDGAASFHEYANPSTCAHRSLPFGTVLLVTNLANGRQAKCTVNDRGPYIAGRIVDLSRTTFGELAPVSSGVIQVSIEW
jgi:rare lipoprotein A